MSTYETQQMNFPVDSEYGSTLVEGLARPPRLLELWRLFVRRYKLVIGITLLLTLLALAYSLAEQRAYSATAQLLFQNNQFDQTLFGSTFAQPNTDPTRQAATNQALVNLPVVAQLAAKSSGTISFDQLQSELAVSPAGGSDLVNVTVTDPSPKRAASLANAVALEYISYQKGVDRAQVLDALTLLNKQIRAGTQSKAVQQILIQRAQDLRVLADAETGNAELVQPARVPLSPSVPRTKRNLILGILGGIVLGFLVAFFRERIDSRVRSPEDLEALLDAPLLAQIPEDGSLAGPLTGSAELPPPEREAFRRLYASLKYFDLGVPLRELVVISPSAGDGKSTVSWHLAAAAAEAGTHVLVVECDLRRPTLSARLKRGGGSVDGLSGVLSGQNTASSSVRDLEGSAMPDVMPSGPAPPNPTALIASERMEEFVEWAANSYDLVIYDVPPPNAVADAHPLLKPKVGRGTICVVWLGARRARDVVDLRALVHKLGSSVTGVVANRIKANRSAYDYYYQSDGETGSASAAASTSR